MKSLSGRCPVIKHWALWLSLVVGGMGSAYAGWVPARRPSVDVKDSGHMILPFYFDVPGIGAGYGLIGDLTNAFGTKADLVGAFFWGDAKGQALALYDYDLIPDRLEVNVQGFHLQDTTFPSYFQRGTDSPKDNYILSEMPSDWIGVLSLTASFWERRLQSVWGISRDRYTVSALRDHGGNVILRARNPTPIRIDSAKWGLRVDLTDDEQNPHKGLLVEPSVTHTPRYRLAPATLNADLSVSGYVPVGRGNVWVVNAFRSDVHTRKKGVSDLAAVGREVGFDCSSLSDPADQAACQDYLQSLADANEHGSATPLGGTSRLRSFVDGRFQGAHTEFLGTEWRWNLSRDVRAFDVGVMKDVRTAFQIAFFYELGTVADHRRDLWESTRFTYGAGLRLVTASGFAYRLDFAQGKEGFEPVIFFQYPW